MLQEFELTPNDLLASNCLRLTRGGLIRLKKTHYFRIYRLPPLTPLLILQVTGIKDFPFYVDANFTAIHIFGEKTNVAIKMYNENIKLWLDEYMGTNL